MSLYLKLAFTFAVLACCFGALFSFLTHDPWWKVSRPLSAGLAALGLIVFVLATLACAVAAVWRI